jgi:tetratricopeptide (TPR) repeat protein
MRLEPTRLQDSGRSLSAANARQPGQLVARLLGSGVQRGAKCMGRLGFASLLLSVSALAQSPFERAAELVRLGDYRAAIESTEQVSDPLQAAQAQLHVYHYAGDLDSALAAGRAGLAIDPKEPWLLENTAYVAISLGLGQPALAWLERLEEVRPGQAPDWMLEEAQKLSENRSAEATASSRAKTVVWGALVGLIGALLVGARLTR